MLPTPKMMTMATIQYKNTKQQNNDDKQQAMMTNNKMTK